MLSEFPKFKVLELEDKDDIESITKKYPPYSDFNFVSMWSWDIEGNMRVSVLNKNLVVRFTDYLTGNPFFSFLGDNMVNETIETLLEFSKKEGMGAELKLVPEDSLKGLDTSRFKAVEDRDNFDYIYDLDQLSKYEGSKFATERNLMSRFLRKFPNRIIKICDLNNPQTIDDILTLDNLWVKNKELKSYDFKIENESKALNRILKTAARFKLIVIGVYVDNKLVCFCLNELLSEGNAISHFAKSNVNFSGSYSFLMKENASFLFKQGRKYLNYEQDLGILNLRYAKESFRPIYFLNKFVCTYKSQVV